jgi:hypothetical protein
MEDVILLDSLYLFIKYPSKDIFEKYYRIAKDSSYRTLKFGLPYNQFVIKNGGSGYKISVWKNDARIFLTDQVDEVVGKEKGMGAWVQFGPKTLISNPSIHEEVDNFLIEVGIGNGYEKRISRLDLAIDLLGVSMKAMNLAQWQEGWVGRSKVSASYFNSKTSDLETITIGKRTSPVFLRVYDKVAQAKKEGDLEYWIDVWKGFMGDVTRVEWEIKPKKGNFNIPSNFDDFTGIEERELVNYLMQWGRLCKPDEKNINKNRWEDDDLWTRVRYSTEKWSDGINWATTRFGKEFHGMSDAYKKSFFGQLSSGMARFSENEPNIFGLIKGMEKSGIRLEAINAKAKFKQRVFKNL